MGEQPLCSYLEKILSKNMELMERRLTDYIDQRIHKLQEHIDGKIALLVDLLHNPSSPPTGTPLRHSDSGERLSNGERWALNMRSGGQILLTYLLQSPTLTAQGKYLVSFEDCPLTYVSDLEVHLNWTCYCNSSTVHYEGTWLGRKLFCL